LLLIHPPHFYKGLEEAPLLSYGGFRLTSLFRDKLVSKFEYDLDKMKYETLIKLAKVEGMLERD
jgi:hypothetical protein